MTDHLQTSGSGRGGGGEGIGGGDCPGEKTCYSAYNRDKSAEWSGDWGEDADNCLRLDLSVRWDLDWRLLGGRPRPRLGLETWDWQLERREGGSLQPTGLKYCISSCGLTPPSPLLCSGPELHESLGQTIFYTEIYLTGEMVSVDLVEVATLSYLDRKLGGGTTHFTAFLHHICIKCLQWALGVILQFSSKSPIASESE